MRHFFVDVEGLEFFHKRFFVLEQGIECQAFGETELILVSQLLGLGVGDDLGFVVVLEKVFKFLLVENYDGVVDNSDLIIIGHFQSDFGGEWLKALAV